MSDVGFGKVLLALFYSIGIYFLIGILAILAITGLVCVIYYVYFSDRSKVYKVKPVGDNSGEENGGLQHDLPPFPSPPPDHITLPPAIIDGGSHRNGIPNTENDVIPVGDSVPDHMTRPDHMTLPPPVPALLRSLRRERSRQENTLPSSATAWEDDGGLIIRRDSVDTPIRSTTLTRHEAMRSSPHHVTSSPPDHDVVRGIDSLEMRDDVVTMTTDTARSGNKRNKKPWTEPTPSPFKSCDSFVYTSPRARSGAPRSGQAGHTRTLPRSQTHGALSGDRSRTDSSQGALSRDKGTRDKGTRDKGGRDTDRGARDKGGRDKGGRDTDRGARDKGARDNSQKTLPRDYRPRAALDLDLEYPGQVGGNHRDENRQQKHRVSVDDNRFSTQISLSPKQLNSGAPQFHLPIQENRAEPGHGVYENRDTINNHQDYINNHQDYIDGTSLPRTPLAPDHTAGSPDVNTYNGGPRFVESEDGYFVENGSFYTDDEFMEPTIYENHQTGLEL